MSRDHPTREKVKDTVDDLVSSLLYYDRKDDEEGLLRGDIENAIDAGVFSADDIVKWFSDALREQL